MQSSKQFIVESVKRFWCISSSNFGIPEENLRIYYTKKIQEPRIIVREHHLSYKLRKSDLPDQSANIIVQFDIIKVLYTKIKMGATFIVFMISLSGLILAYDLEHQPLCKY